MIESSGGLAYWHLLCSFFQNSIHNLQVPPCDPPKKFKPSYPLCLYLLRVLPYGNHYVKVHQVLIFLYALEQAHRGPYMTQKP